MRRRRWRWIGVGLVVVLGLYFVLDIVMVQYLESRGAAELARTMSAEEATIELGGVPFIPRFFGGTLSGVTVEVTGASAAGGLRVQSVEARMEKAHFDAGALFALARSSFATKSKLTAEQPFVLLELGEGDLNDFIRRHISVVGDVQVKASGVEVRFLKEGLDPAEYQRPSTDDLTKPARFLPTASGGRLHLILTSSSQIPSGYRAEAQRIEDLIKLPKFPKGLDPQVGIKDGLITAEAQGSKVTVDIGEATDEERQAS